MMDNNICITREEFIGYLQKKLNSDDSIRIEKHLETCEFCKDALDGFKENLQSDQYNSSIEKLDSRYLKKSNNRTIHYSLVASLLIISTYFFTENSNDIYSTYYEKYNFDLHLTRNGTSEKVDLKRGFIFYQRGEYEKSIHILDKMKNETRNDSTYFLLGQIKLISNQSPIDEFDKVIELDNSFVDASYWYKAMYYFRDQQDAKALEELAKIEKSSTYFKRAVSIIKKYNE